MKFTGRRWTCPKLPIGPLREYQLHECSHRHWCTNLLMSRSKYGSYDSPDHGACMGMARSKVYYIHLSEHSFNLHYSNTKSIDRSIWDPDLDHKYLSTHIASSHDGTDAQYCSCTMHAPTGRATCTSWVLPVHRFTAHALANDVTYADGASIDACTGKAVDRPLAGAGRSRRAYVGACELATRGHSAPRAGAAVISLRRAGAFALPFRLARWVSVSLVGPRAAAPAQPGQGARLGTQRRNTSPAARKHAPTGNRLGSTVNSLSKAVSVDPRVALCHLTASVACGQSLPPFSLFFFFVRRTFVLSDFREVVLCTILRARLRHETFCAPYITGHPRTCAGSVVHAGERANRYQERVSHTTAKYSLHSITSKLSVRCYGI